MNGFSVMSLMQKYSTCPQCGSDKVGNGTGSLIIEDEWFYRGCQCGFQKVVDEDDVELDLKVVKPYLKRP